MTGRVVVFGIDGGTWSILKPLMERGLMPNLAALAREGASFDLQSTMPPITPPAWTTFQTGVGPGRHGVYDFGRPRPGSYRTEFLNSAQIQAPTIWQMVSRAGGRVIALNVPVTYPPYPVNGVMVTGLETPGLDAGFTYPDELGDELRRAVPDYRITTTLAVFNFGGLAALAARLKRMIEARVRAMEFLLDRQPWELAMVHFQAPDILQHAVYPHLDPSCPGHNPRIYRKAIEVYRALDEGLGRLRELVAGPGTLTVVMSDHGFRRVERSFYLNEWLAQEGFLGRKRSSPARSLFRAATVRLRQWDRLNVATLVGRRARDRIRRKLTVDVLVDWSLTRAHASGWWAGFIYANVRGRSEQGVVDPEAAWELLTRIGDSLATLKTADGLQVIRRVYPRTEVFQGAEAGVAPDLLVEPAPGFEINKTLSGQLYRTHLVRRDPLGTHDPRGILVLGGAGVRSGPGESVPAMVDVPFTVLHYLGLPVPDHLEGRFIAEAFDDTWLRGHPISRAPYPELGGPWASSKTAVHSASDEERIGRRLEDLGYM